MLLEFRFSCVLQMINHLRFVDTKLLEKALRQRLGSRQAEPTALKCDRAAGAPHRLDQGSSAHGCGAPSLGRACVDVEKGGP